MPTTTTPSPQSTLASPKVIRKTQKILLPHDWEPRPYQVPALAALDGGINRAATCWHRRAGKDSCAINYTAKRTQEKVAPYWHMLPTARQARKVVWEGIDKQGRRIIDQAFPAAIRESTRNDEMVIKLKNGSTWSCLGSDNFDANVGANPFGVVMSEFALMDPRAWEYIRPILVENGGWMWAISTYRGKNNHFYKMVQKNKDNPLWFTQVLSILDTGVMTKEQVDEEIKSGMDPRRAAQEFYCDPDVTNAGAIYATQLTALYGAGKIGSVPYDPRYPVQTSWDLGHRDANAIWFSQDVGGEIRFIDYDEARGLDLKHFIKVVKEKPYVYSRHIGPHDTNKMEYGAGVTIIEQARANGLEFTIAPKLGIEEGINAVRTMLPRCRFDAEACARGIEVLEAYEYEVKEDDEQTDESKLEYKSTPGPKWASNGCDALRMLAVTPAGQGLASNWAAQILAQQAPPIGHNGGPPVNQWHQQPANPNAGYDPLAEMRG